jgi:hypothetical protein
LKKCLNASKGRKNFTQWMCSEWSEDLAQNNLIKLEVITFYRTRKCLQIICLYEMYDAFRNSKWLKIFQIYSKKTYMKNFKNLKNIVVKKLYYLKLLRVWKSSTTWTLSKKSNPENSLNFQFPFYFSIQL